MILALVSLALAGEPTRCVATWKANADACALRGEFSGSATALSPKGAERAAVRQLVAVVELSGAAMRARTPTLSSAQFMTCAERAEADALLNCFADPALAEPGYCFAELPDADCWNGQVLPIEEVEWRALDVGRKALCAAVDARLVDLKYSDVELRRATCAASCAEKATVRCPK